MKLVVITGEKFLRHEAYLINMLFEKGLQLLHFRKPQASVEETGCVLNEIDSRFHSRIVIHDHFPLIENFGLKGIHLNRRNPAWYQKTGISVSSSCHSFEEIAAAKACDYVFLSPVFDSISKAGYRKGFVSEHLSKGSAAGIINERVIALGGITPEKVSEIKLYRFGGVAVLGSLWADFDKDENVDDLLGRFDKLKEICMG